MATRDLYIIFDFSQGSFRILRGVSQSRYYSISREQELLDTLIMNGARSNFYLEMEKIEWERAERFEEWEDEEEQW